MLLIILGPLCAIPEANAEVPVTIVSACADLARAVKAASSANTVAAAPA